MAYFGQSDPIYDELLSWGMEPAFFDPMNPIYYIEPIDIQPAIYPDYSAGAWGAGGWESWWGIPELSSQPPLDIGYSVGVETWGEYPPTDLGIEPYFPSLPAPYSLSETYPELSPEALGTQIAPEPVAYPYPLEPLFPTEPLPVETPYLPIPPEMQPIAYPAESGPGILSRILGAISGGAPTAPALPKSTPPLAPSSPLPLSTRAPAPTADDWLLYAALGVGALLLLKKDRKK